MPVGRRRAAIGSPFKTSTCGRLNLQPARNANGGGGARAIRPKRADRDASRIRPAAGRANSLPLRRTSSAAAAELLLNLLLINPLERARPNQATRPLTLHSAGAAGATSSSRSKEFPLLSSGHKSPPRPPSTTPRAAEGRGRVSINSDALTASRRPVLLQRASAATKLRALLELLQGAQIFRLGRSNRVPAQRPAAPPPANWRPRRARGDTRPARHINHSPVLAQRATSALEARGGGARLAG